MNLVVTGASGFLAHHVAKHLASSGFEVTAASRGEMKLPLSIRQLRVDTYADVPAGGTLIHLAEQNSITAAQASAEAYQAETVARLRQLIGLGFDRVVYASSAAVYGDQSMNPHRTDEALQPAGIYARTKLMCESEVTRAGGLIVRPANIVGPGMSRDSVVETILRQVRGGRADQDRAASGGRGTGVRAAVEVRDDAPVRDFLWIGNFVDCVEKLLRSGTTGIFNVGSGRGTSVGELARIALRVAGQAERRIVALEPAGVRSHLVLDVLQTMRVVPWRPSTPLDTALCSMLECSDA